MPADELRVLMVAPTSFFSDYGGHIRILEETRALQALGHSVTIVTYYKGKDIPGIPIYRTAPLPWRPDYEVGSSRHKLVFDLYLAGRAAQVAWRVRPHIVHGHMHEGALIGGALARLWRVPLVFDFQGSLTGEMVDHGFLDPAGRLYPWVLRLERFITGRLPQAILTSSGRAQTILREQFGVRPDRLFALPDCANLRQFDPERYPQEARMAVRRRLGLPLDRPVVAYLGLLADYQGTDHLVQLARHLRDAGHDIHVLIMGFPNVDHYRAMAVALGVADRVTFTGRVDYERDAPAFIAAGDVTIAPKMSATEGSGKVLNYMAMARPVVAYDTPVHREYLGPLGVYVPVGDVPGLGQAVVELCADPGRAAALGAALRRRAAERFSWTAAGNLIESVYRGLTSEKGAV